MGGLPALMAAIALAGAAATAVLRMQGWIRAVWVMVLLPVAAAAALTLAGSATGGGRGLEQAAIAEFLLLPLAVGALAGWPLGALVLWLRERRRGD